MGNTDSRIRIGAVAWDFREAARTVSELPTKQAFQESSWNWEVLRQDILWPRRRWWKVTWRMESDME